MKKLTFDVVGALIKDNGKILVCQRKANDRFGLQWEFPGGKVEKDEDKKEALKRELKEEIGIEVKVGDLIDAFEDEIPEMKIDVYLYNCAISRGRPRCIECRDIRWATIEEIKDLNLAPIDKKIALYLQEKWGEEMKNKKKKEKRVKARIKSKLKVSYKQAGSEGKHKCDTNDISESGIQIVTDNPLDEQKSVSLEINLPYPKCMVHAIGTIRWHKEPKDPDTGKTKYIYGIKFDQIDQTAQDNIFFYMYERFKLSAGGK